MRVFRSFVFAFALVAVAGSVQVASAAIDARMLRYPDVSAEQIAFVYAGDVWIVSKTGGAARRLSTPRGEESFPRFSPDGAQIAYSANYDGNTDIYTVPVEGGLPQRVTHHPGVDRMLDWYPDGSSLLYASGMTSGTNRFSQLWRVSAAGGLPERLPVPYGEFGALAADGQRLAYTPNTRDFRTWKRYRGGLAPEIWFFDLASGDARNLTRNPANDSQPMWYGDTLYFLSDRDATSRYNIWSLDPASGAARQVTQFDQMDVAFPAIGPDAIVFTIGSKLYRLDLPDESLHEVEVEVVTDRATLRPRMQKVDELVSRADVSPSGKRVVFEARGELFSVPVEHGFTTNLTRSSGVAERHPAWSPDGEWIAYFSDRSGEYELTLRRADGTGDEQSVTTLGPGFRYDLYWSPDSRKLAFVDQAMKIQVYDRDSDAVVVVDQDLFMFHGALQAFQPAWSADSRWLAWHRTEDESENAAIYVYDTRDKQRRRLTSGFFADTRPAFDPEGKYLYLLTSREFQPQYSDFDNGWVYANTTRVAAIPLRADVPSPLPPRNDDEADDDKKPEEDAKDEKKEKEEGKKKGKKSENPESSDDEKDKKPEAVTIDFEGIERRLVVLPPAAGNYGRLVGLRGKLLLHRLPRTGSGDEDRPIVVYDFEKREEKTVVADADGFAAAAGGDKLFVVKDRKFYVVGIEPDQKLEKPIDTSGLIMELDPAAEWRQIFHDVWRLQRDYFYDPNMHRVDWNAMRERYGALLDDVVTRWDLNFVIGEMIAELNASHSYRGGGDQEQSEQRGVGLLGADFELDQGAYRIAHIVDGGLWDSEVRSPLLRPGVEVKAGDYLLEVNGAPLDVKKDPWAAFAGLAGQTVQLTVNDRPTLKGARRILVETLDDESRLRNLEWIEANRRRVEEATDGRVGYLYVPDTGVNGQNELVRMFQAQYRKPALIIDERFNSGGQIPDRFVELLNRPIFNYWAVRDGRDWTWPPVTHDGPKVMLVNGWAGSGGDALPFYFREAGLGPLIGTRTWGGLIGISGAPTLIDGGVATVPTFAIYSAEGEWIIEGRGVDPDIEVIDDPAELARGRDPQLERAIEEALAALEREPPTRPSRPAYPDRSGR